MLILKDDPRHSILIDDLKKDGKLTQEQVEKAMSNALIYFTEHGYPPYDSFDIYLNSFIKTFEGIYTPEEVIILAAKAIENAENN